LYRFSERAKLVLLGVALLIMLTIIVFTSVSTVQATRSFQHQYNAVKTENVNAIHPWMTVHVISNIYHVPETYLCNSLKSGTPKTLRHTTLYEIASRKRQPVNKVVLTVQDAILVYRKEHPSPAKPTPSPQSVFAPLSIEPRSTYY
jgi:hypothetical protein